mgnify:CR=1 FL=1
MAAHHAITSAYAHNNLGMPLSAVSPGFGAIYSDYKAPLVPGVKDTPMPPQKVGRASTRFISFLWLPVLGAWDDASIEKAMQNGGLTELDYAECEFMQVLGTYGEFAVTVYGR